MSIFKNGFRQWFSEMWYGKGGKPLVTQTEVTPQKLQEAVSLKMQAANTKGDAASAQMIAAKTARDELARLVVQHDELKKQAIKAERENDHSRAKKILAMALSVKEKIDSASQRFEQANAAATQLVSEAKKMFKEAKEAANDLPRKVMQLEVNRLMENANRLDSDARLRIESKPSYESLSASIDTQTQRLLIRNVINETDATMDAEIDQVLRESRFEEEYKLLQATARDGQGMADVKLIDDNPVDKAKKLLGNSSIGGLIGIKDSFTAREPEPVKVSVVEPDEPSSDDIGD